MIYPNTNIESWSKDLYIASKIAEDVDDEGNSISVYDTPEQFKFNYRGVESEAESAEFGEDTKLMQRMVIPIKYKNVFKEFDVAYLDGATPDNEVVNGSNANYRLLPPRNGGSVIVIYLRRIDGK